MIPDLTAAMQACDEGRLDDAAGPAEVALRDNPHDAMALAILAQCHLKAGRLGVAYHLFRRVCEYGEHPAIWNNIGHCLDHNAELLDEAEKWFTKCLTEGDFDPVAPLSNLALIHCKRGDHEKAVEFAQDALKLRPDDKGARMNAALSMLAMRRWGEAWDWYDAALGDPTLRRWPAYVTAEAPVWGGRGGCVAIYGEQGLGDQIMFASMAGEAIEAADRVILDVEPRLVRLFQRSFPRAHVTSARATGGQLTIPEGPDADSVFAIGSLGRLYRRTADSFPGAPYLSPCPLRVRGYREMLDATRGHPSDRLAVGIMWQGGIKGTRETQRSMSLSAWRDVLTGFDCEWFSLNHRPGSGSEISRFEAAHGVAVHDWPWILRTQDYDDTAAFVTALDLVVTTQTSVAHLAGALGKEVWVLVPKPAEWRYGTAGEDMPWYSSMRLFRQDVPGDWSGPLARVAEELKKRGVGARKNKVEAYGLR